MFMQRVISPAQCRAARGLLNWTQKQLGDAARVSPSTVKFFEGERKTTHPRTVEALRVAFESAGLEFLARDGVCFSSGAMPSLGA